MQYFSKKYKNVSIIQILIIYKKIINGNILKVRKIVFMAIKIAKNEKDNLFFLAKARISVFFK